ncbi:hypothetical protein CDAR_113591 [Caerostris darwini]|uniref:Uncharacterized protein n=1 Tax=Caerostris darwini TaxID=1538125 RepID=A0AAV4NNH5_9ARAC|nr:hypothetical protein CDAR_113591 [Caerostris darwini]
MGIDRLEHLILNLDTGGVAKQFFPPPTPVSSSITTPSPSCHLTPKETKSKRETSDFRERYCPKTLLMSSGTCLEECQVRVYCDYIDRSPCLTLESPKLHTQFIYFIAIHPSTTPEANRNSFYPPFLNPPQYSTLEAGVQIQKTKENE